MSAAAAVLAIVVASGEAGRPMTTSLVATVEESLGARTPLRLIEVPEPAEADVWSIEERLGASAVITLIWKEPAHVHAVIRMHIARTNRWTERDIGFRSGDTHPEKGRALGFAVASMWPESNESRGETIVPPSQSDSAAVRATNKAPAPDDVAPAPVERRRSKVAPAKTDVAPATTEPDNRGDARPSADISERASVPSTPLPPFPRNGVGLAFRTSTSKELSSVAIGGSLDGVHAVSDQASLRAGIGFNQTSFPELRGTIQEASAALGVEWWAWPADARARRWRAGLRSDLLVIAQRVHGVASEEAPETRQRFLPGADAMAIGLVRVGDAINALAALGGEATFGKTDVRVGNDHNTIATLPVVRLVAYLGLRVGF